LGVRYILFTHRGQLEGLMTKRDIWKVMMKSNTSPHNFEFDRNGPPHMGNSSLSEGLLNDDPTDEM
jgi:hypothetical protein